MWAGRSLSPAASIVLCLVAQSCPTLCDPMDCSPPSSSVHGILQVGLLEWVAMPSSRGPSWCRDRTQVSYIAGGFFTDWASRKPFHWSMASPAQMCTGHHCSVLGTMKRGWATFVKQEDRGWLTYSLLPSRHLSYELILSAGGWRT